LGSGLQKHYGHLTVAHQDAFGAIPEDQVQAIHEKISAIVNDIDPREQTHSVQGSNTDIKVYIKSEGGDIFHKGDGINLLVEHTKCDLKQGHILVCGDSQSDVPMLTYCLEKNPQGTFSLWVTTDEQLRKKVSELCDSFGNKQYVFVSCPEVLLGGMAQATIREISIGGSRTGRISHESD